MNLWDCHSYDVSFMERCAGLGLVSLRLILHPSVFCCLMEKGQHWLFLGSCDSQLQLGLGNLMGNTNGRFMKGEARAFSFFCLWWCCWQKLFVLWLQFLPDKPLIILASTVWPWPWALVAVLFYFGVWSGMISASIRKAASLSNTESLEPKMKRCILRCFRKPFRKGKKYICPACDG